MIELIRRTRWDQAYDFLASGEPPMVQRILALNILFLILFVLRRAKFGKPMTQQGLLFAQGMLLLANILVIFQRDVQSFLDRVI